MTREEVIAAWNNQADKHNQWSDLGEDEKLEWAMSLEREACARACELLRPSKREYDHRFWDACTASAAVIRTRGMSDS